MYLKRIELHGFKSFAERVELEFQPGINAIVGPNGSGKSNIIDAIRWVLGEQSVKTLRGYRLEDVIFAGSHMKKPMGMAEVAVTLDNSDHLIPLDYSEISFIRRTFRSGESEFLINKTPCRLKDIQEILVDSGVGKDGYSVISQGQIDEILTCRPEERRVIFEEAAGIMKHRIRKREAEKRLEETMDNISRIDDVIIELLNQLEPLALQKDIALKYKELSLTYKKMDVNLLLSERETRQKKLNYIMEELQNNQTSLTKIHSLIETLKQKITDYKSKQSATEKTYEKAQDDFYSVDSQIKDLKKDFQMVTAEKSRLENANNDYCNNINRHKEDLETSQKNLELKSDVLEEKIKVINQLELTIDQKEQMLVSLNDEINTKQSVIESVKGDVIDLLNYASEKRNAISQLNTLKSNLEKRVNQIEYEKMQIKGANDVTLKEISDISEEIACLMSLCNELELSIQALINLKNQIATELDKSEKKEMQKQQELTVATSRLRTLKEIDASYEGYQFGVKNLLIALKNKKYFDAGIYGSVADIISVNQKYDVAVETALGQAMQNIVCESEENAKKAIEFLKKNNYGRVTFLPLSTVKARHIEKNEEKYLSIKGCIGPAIKLISFDKKYFAVLAYLLGRVLVSESLEDAINIAKQCNFAFKIVTIQGEVLSPGGSITGGSQRRSPYLLSRKRQINDCESQIKELDIELAQLKQYNQKLRNEIKDKQKLIEDNTASLYSSKSELEVLKKQLQEKQYLLTERQQREKQLDDEKQQIQSESQEIITQIALLEADIGSIDIQNTSTQSRVKSLQEEIDKSNEIKEKMSEEITKLKVKLASFKQEQIAISQSLQSIEEKIKFHMDEINKYQEKITQNKETVDLIDKKLSDYEINIKELMNIQKQHQELLESSREQRDILNFNLDKAQEELNKLEKQRHQVETTLHNLHIQEATLNIEINQIDNQLYERYSLTFDEALKFKNDFSSIEDLKKQLASLKDQIESLGSVNMKAIEDYDNLKARYEFLVSQRDDLIKAKANLDSIIEDVTGTMEKMLLMAIKKVNDEFNKVFSELFEGGRAELIIEGEGSILDCGIEVNAQPPGKKLQNISLLSGGERALTAIALLFAILNTKATPFCVLDEIEAALDDANIARFTRYLKKVSKHTQFILITHRKQTMEAADALYGISMEETAVSKVLAVKIV
ncbi:MAG: chromosome segregation protein SMC [Thermoanaerobacteraceae bacterium]|nr:chromosome segregation protein SMC [Thermoanaerobacteraceae bacterium]